MLAGIVITRNEEKNIVRCLKSLLFCEQIVVVDANSEDQTVRLASDLGAKVINRAWTGYSDQKNFALTQTNADWILSIDADEEVTPELEREILDIVKTPGPYVAFSIPRKTYHSGRWIRWGGWYPNRLVRLFKKDRGKWIGDEVHEFWQAEGPIGSIRNDLLHHSFVSISDQVERNNRYSTLGALALQKSGYKFSRTRLIYKPISKFFETYILKFGFLDGFPGFIISVSAAYSVFLKWAKLWEISRGETA